jgi:hypothetical protein
MARAYLHNPRAPEKRYEILGYDQDRGKVRVKEDWGFSFELPKDTIKQLGWTITREDDDAERTGVCEGLHAGTED